MKETLALLAGCATIVLSVAIMVGGPDFLDVHWKQAAVQDEAYHAAVDRALAYDPNAPEYKYLSMPPANWKKAFGDTERARVLFTVSELRIGLEMSTREVAKLRQMLVGEPNEVAE